MKCIVLIAIVLVTTGCASIKSLQDLELEAASTGDWSAVEQRERLLARRAAAKGQACAPGYAVFCRTYTGQDICTCVTREDLRDVFAGR